MKRRKRDLTMVAGILTGLLLMGTALSLTDRAAPETAAPETAAPPTVERVQDTPPAPAVTESERALTAEPVLSEPDPPEEPAEDLPDPNEAELIEQALLAKGYYRDDVPLDYELQDILHAVCEQYRIPYPLALGLIETESGFRTDADNGLCYGLCALNRHYFQSGLSPAGNIQAGMELLRSNYDRYGTWEAALTAYNAGHDTGSRRYARGVLAKARAWEEKGVDVHDDCWVDSWPSP